MSLEVLKFNQNASKVHSKKDREALFQGGRVLIFWFSFKSFFFEIFRSSEA